MTDYLVEVLVDGQPTSTTQTDDGSDIEVLVGTVYSEGTVSDVTMVEVFEVTPDQDTKIESYQFSHAGDLSIKTGDSQLPITGGTYGIASIAARVATPPTGSNAVLDIKKNGTTVFVTPGDRPTIVAGASDATVGSWGTTTLTTGDYLSVDISQIGSSTPGAHLVLLIRLRKVS